MQNSILNFFIENIIWFAVLFAVVFLLKKCIGKHFSATMHYLIWGIVVLKLIVPMSIPSIVSPWNLVPEQQETAVVATESQQAEDALPAFGASDQTNPAAPNQAAIREETSTQSVQFSNAHIATKKTWMPDPGQICLGSWVSGMLAFGLRLFVRRIRLTRAIRASGMDTPNLVIQSVFAQCKADLGIKKDIHVIVQSYLSGPAIMGAVHPVMLLPESLSKCMDEQYLRHICLHELIHYKKKDLLVLQILNCLNIVYWFNPLVWACFGMIRKDMETCCDNRVVNLIGTDARRVYIETVLRFAGQKKEPRLMAALSMSDGRITMQNRIKGMFLNKKTKKSVKITVFLVSAMMLISAFTTACQPAPDKMVVIGKQMSINQTVEDSIKGKVLTKFPETCQSTYVDGKITVAIDASVELPDTNAMPIADVAPRQFTQEDADRLVQTLLQGQPLFEPASQLTKAQIKDSVAQLRRMQKEQTSKEAVIKAESTLSELEEQAMDAPDEVERIPSDGLMTEIEDSPVKMKVLNVEADLGRLCPAGLYISSSETGKTASVWFRNQDAYEGFRLDTQQPAGVATGVKLSKEEAQQIAEETAEQLESGLSLSTAGVVVNDNAGIDSDTNPKQAYIFWFTRTVNDVPTTFDENNGTEGKMPEGADADEYEPYPYERMYIIVDDRGVAELYWLSPATVLDVVSPNAQLLNFDEVLNRFKTQFAAHKASLALTDPEYIEWYDESGIETITDENISAYSYTIDRITLGLMRLPMENNPNLFIMVPVWDFYGEEHVDYSTPVLDEMTGENVTENTFDHSKSSLLTINAIDGSVIDRSAGGVTT